MILSLAAAIVVAAAPSPAPAKVERCRTRACHLRVNKRRAHAKWRREIRGHRDLLVRIRLCESHGNYHAVSASGLYRGAYQFSRSTWQSIGGRGHVAGRWGTSWASRLEQDVRTVRLARRSLAHWPVCGRGLTFSPRTTAREATK